MLSKCQEVKKSQCGLVESLEKRNLTAIFVRESEMVRDDGLCSLLIYSVVETLFFLAIMMRMSRETGKELFFFSCTLFEK